MVCSKFSCYYVIYNLNIYRYTYIEISELVMISMFEITQIETCFQFVHIPATFETITISSHKFSNI